MPSKHSAIGKRLSAIRLVILDVDGVMTDGTIVYDNRGNISRTFHVHDGFGIVRAKDAGLLIAIATGKTSRAVARRAKDLRIADVHQGLRDKLPVFRRLCKKYRLTPEQVCCIADDEHDLPLLRAAGLSAAPADALPAVRASVHLVLSTPAGRGAVRELLDLILRSQGLLS
jgi:3-deoxy-D-manno-octulosonate 8-phosphate phosphatase (KDO 8-P phosphatase)